MGTLFSRACCRHAVAAAAGPMSFLCRLAESLLMVDLVLVVVEDYHRVAKAISACRKIALDVDKLDNCA